MEGDCENHGGENFFTYIPKFDKMQILKIPRNSFLDDNCMKTVGTYCKDLRCVD